jgi:hypothetical protein
MKKIILLTIMAMTFSLPCYAGNVPSIPGLSGFSFFDEIAPDNSGSVKDHAPITIPKAWKLIVISNGEKMNCNDLWFQDPQGNVWMIDGFMIYGRFVISGSVQRIKAR